MGDVALTMPVIRDFLKQYPQHEITLITQSAFGSFFRSVPNLDLFYIDLKGRHKGLFGIFRLYTDLRSKNKIDCVIDLHDVLRSIILRLFFRISGVPVFIIDKGRREKKDLITGKKKVPLKHTADRYYDVFARAGFPVVQENGPWIIPSSVVKKKIAGLIFTHKTLNIGVAPFARHALKVWPEDYMVTLLKMISEKRIVKFWLFGGEDEYERLNNFRTKVPASYLVTGNFTLDEELDLISRMNFMITMDSANMHLAALTGARVISLWGGTDPLTGFGAWKQPDNFSVRIPVDELTCRPCTVYGKGKCWRGDFACMIWLTPEKVLSEIERNGLLDNINPSTGKDEQI